MWQKFLEWLFAPAAAKPAPAPEPDVLDMEPPAKPEPKDDSPAWLTVAYGEVGQKEFTGAAKNPRIAEYHRASGYDGTEDDAWCSSFACWAMEKAGFKSTNSAWARSWLDYGDKLTKPKKGCIVVYWREPQGSGNGHVHFYVSETATHIIGLGGNQDNAVCLKAYPKSAVLGYRWPKSFT